jgi:hypothetical protein
MKGCTTISELENLPNHYSHTIYKEFIDTQMDKDKQEAVQSEQMMDELSDAMT